MANFIQNLRQVWNGQDRLATTSIGKAGTYPPCQRRYAATASQSGKSKGGGTYPPCQRRYAATASQSGKSKGAGTYPPCQRRYAATASQSGKSKGGGTGHPHRVITPPLTIKPNDPLAEYFLTAPGAVEIEKLHMQSPTLQALKEAGVKLVVPMINQGQLVGLLNLGPRMSEQDYSTDDRGLLNTLATQAAPAVRVAQLVGEQHMLAREREHMEQEMRVARLIQQTLLPKDLPELPGWQLAAYYRPARAVGGDFYDFLSFEDGRLGIVIGDVTDKGVPAALLMATTRSILRSVAQTENSPGKVLEQTNNLLCPDVPARMFVTCLYAILDPSSGRLRYANAGHDQPYQRHKEGVSELWARGMPLGLMPDMGYEEKETILAQDESVLFYSDGLVEAHNAGHEMFGFPRLKTLMAEQAGNKTIIDVLLDKLTAFTGSGWEQEDDVTLVTLQRTGG